MSKALLQDVKKIISPESTVIVQKIHHIKDIVLNDKMVRGALLIVLSYIGIYLLATLVGVYYGYPLVDALFDSVSAGSTTGLSCGVTSPAMPAPLKVVCILAMWMCRLEFMAIFGLFGFIFASYGGK
ncbi:MAG: potassium transporter TrkG [Actinomycetota bacterium]|nr:potassium transporter TrkG [Actinomycetota bacterium]